MLAESALAAWRTDRAQARARALAASALTYAADLAWHHGWATWHLGCLATAAARVPAIHSRPPLDALLPRVTKITNHNQLLGEAGLSVSPIGGLPA